MTISDQERERRQYAQRHMTALRPTNTSGYRGVYRNNNPRLRYPWCALIQDGDARYWCGMHRTAADAARAYDAKAFECWGIRPNRDLGLLS